MGKKVGFAVVFTNITRKKTLPQEASINITKMTIIKIALKQIHKREDKRCIIYTDFQSSIQSIEVNKEKENHLMLNQIFDNIKINKL